MYSNLLWSSRITLTRWYLVRQRFEILDIPANFLVQTLIGRNQPSHWKIRYLLHMQEFANMLERECKSAIEVIGCLIQLPQKSDE